jgi:ribosome-associated protein
VRRPLKAGARSESEVAEERPVQPSARKKARPSKSRTDEASSRTRRVAIAIAEAALDKKAANVEIIDVRGKVDYADYVIVMSGRSERQVGALARHVEESLKRNEQARCLSVEGIGQGVWVLMDFGDVVVHVFHEDTRGYYDLESLWMDAARVAVGAEHAR